MSGQCLYISSFHFRTLFPLVTTNPCICHLTIWDIWGVQFAKLIKVMHAHSHRRHRLQEISIGCICGSLLCQSITNRQTNAEQSRPSLRNEWPIAVCQSAEFHQWCTNNRPSQQSSKSLRNVAACKKAQTNKLVTGVELRERLFSRFAVKILLGCLTGSVVQQKINTVYFSV